MENYLIAGSTHIVVVQFHTITIPKYVAVIRCHHEVAVQAVVIPHLIIPILNSVVMEL